MVQGSIKFGAGCCQFVFMGVGMVVAVPRENAAALVQEIEAAGEVVYDIGAVAEGIGVTFEPGFQPVP